MNSSKFNYNKIQLEKIVFDIASTLAMKMNPDVDKIITFAFLAYVLKESDTTEIDEIYDFINDNYSHEISMYVEKYGFDFDKLKYITEKYNSTDLKSVVVFFKNEYGVKSSLERGEYETPHQIIEIARKILNIEGKRVADFGCGRGAFFVNAYEDNPLSIDAIDINEKAASISAIRAKLLDDSINVKLGDMLDVSKEKEYDVIFSDYPLGLKISSLNNYEQYLNDISSKNIMLKKTSPAAWLFNLNIINHLKDKGKSFVFTSVNTTWNVLDKNNRKYFVDNGYIETIIEFPPCIIPGIGVKTVAIILSKNNKSVRMIDASHLGMKGRRQHILESSDVDYIFEHLVKESDISKDVTNEEIIKNDYYLAPDRYFAIDDMTEDGVEFGSIIKRITRGAQIKAKDLDHMVSDEETPYQYLMLKNIQSGIVDDLPYLKYIEDRLDNYCIKDKSLIISKNGLPFKVAVVSVPEGKKVLANANLYVIEIDEKKADVYYLDALFNSKQGEELLNRLAVGAAMPNIPVQLIKKMIIPLPSLDEQKRIGEEYQIREDKVKKLMVKLDEAKEELKTVFNIEANWIIM